MSKTISIDLGTVIENSEGSRTSPSIDGFTKSGDRLVGMPYTYIRPFDPVWPTVVQQVKHHLKELFVISIFLLISNISHSQVATQIKIFSPKYQFPDFPAKSISIPDDLVIFNLKTTNKSLNNRIKGYMMNYKDFFSNYNKLRNADPPVGDSIMASYLGQLFDGHYFVLSGACGSQCQYFDLLDTKTGIIYNGLGSSHGVSFSYTSSMVMLDSDAAIVDTAEQRIDSLQRIEINKQVDNWAKQNAQKIDSLESLANDLKKSDIKYKKYLNEIQKIIDSKPNSPKIWPPSIKYYDDGVTNPSLWVWNEKTKKFKQIQ